MLLLQVIISSIVLLPQPSYGWAGNFLGGAETVQSNSCCSDLKKSLKHKVAFPGSKSYVKSLSTWWSAQEQEVHPGCIVLPASVHDVAEAISLLTKEGGDESSKCSFAIKGGGHTPWAGAANIKNGVTIDLGLLDYAVLSKDRKIVTIGPGARWVDVYNSLIPHGLITSGGRVADVGVGGLTLGGGISFFTPRYGFVCDNVENFEVVTSSGEIINANAKNHTDLWRALRGGSNNFGVVTAFQMRTFEQGDFWGGVVNFPISTREQQFKAFENFTKSTHYDPYSALINSYVYTATTGWFISNSLEYTKSNPAEPNPPVFHQFTSLKQTANTMRITNLSDLTLELSSQTPNGLRDLFTTATFANDAKMVNKFFDLANNTVQRLKDVPGLVFSASFQPFSEAITLKGANNGGNSLGISTADGDMFNVLTTVIWNSSRHDVAVNREVRALFKEAEAAGKAMGVHRKYIYLNYADKWQDPIRGYGKNVAQQLRKVSQKYDPKQVFQQQVPGGFKLK